MVGLQVARGWLEPAPGTLTLDIASPFFQPDQVPGTLSYPFGLPMTPANLRALDFPHLRVAQGDAVPNEPCRLYLDGVLRWVGSLVLVDVDLDKHVLAYHFLADAADLQSRIEGLTLPQLDLGTVALQPVPDAADYALPCLRNAVFYDQDGGQAAQPDYGGVVNYYRDGAYQLLRQGKRYPLVPMLRLVPLLRRVLAAVGYALSGPWLDSDFAKRLVVYCDRAAEDAQGHLLQQLVLNRHVPAVGVGELLIALQGYLGLAYSFHPVRPELRIDTLAALVADPAYVPRTGAGPARLTPAPTGGYTLALKLDDNDELNKTLDVSWATFLVGDGKEKRSPAAGTLQMVRETDPSDPDRRWLVPAVAAPGASPLTADDSRCPLLLLLDLGLQPDEHSHAYPLASAEAENYAGQLVGPGTLRWAGERGLYARCHAPWLDFLARAATHERDMRCTVADLLTLDPARKELVEGRKFLWEKVSLNLSTTGRPLAKATFTYRTIRL